VKSNKPGNYYYDVEKNCDEMKKYYLMSIDKGDSNAMNQLGCYYENIEKNYDEAKKYYLMAIDKGNSNAMNQFGCYYENIEKNYDEAKKYYLMAIDKSNSVAMNNLGYYYHNIEKNYDEAKKYYLMAIKNGCDVAQKNYDKLQNFLFLELLNDISDINYELVDNNSTCLICKNEKKIILNFNCNNKHTHYYCISCCKEWYKTNETKCLVCFNKIITENVKLEIEIKIKNQM
jgi:tetratricopeptide (TPR) repeat protein